MSYDHVETVGGKMQWTQAAVRRWSPTNTARPLMALSSVGRKTEKWNVFTTTTINYYNRTQHSKPLR